MKTKELENTLKVLEAVGYTNVPIMINNGQDGIVDMRECNVEATEYLGKVILLVKQGK